MFNYKLPSSMLNDKILSDTSKKVLQEQWNLYNELKKETIDNCFLKNDTTTEIMLKEGTLLHGAIFNENNLRSISKHGILSGELLGKKEDGETHYCADFYRVPESMSLSEYIKYCSTPESNSRLRKPKIEASRLPNINNKLDSLAFIIDSSNSKLKELLSKDIYRENENFENLKNIVNFDAINNPILFGKKERLSAVLCGISNNFINGILVNEPIRSNPTKINTLKKLFRNQFILGMDGKVISQSKCNYFSSALDNNKCIQSITPNLNNDNYVSKEFKKVDRHDHCI